MGPRYKMLQNEGQREPEYNKQIQLNGFFPASIRAAEEIKRSQMICNKWVN